MTTVRHKEHLGGQKSIQMFRVRGNMDVAVGGM